MTAPPYECPTRTTGPDCRSITAFVNLTSSAKEVSGCCTTETVYPSFLRMLATASQPEPSANAPCTRTTFFTGANLLVCAVSGPPNISGKTTTIRAGTMRVFIRQPWAGSSVRQHHFLGIEAGLEVGIAGTCFSKKC